MFLYVCSFICVVYRIARVFSFVSFPKDVRIHLGFQILRFLFCVWKAFSTDGTLTYLRYQREKKREASGERERERKGSLSSHGLRRENARSLSFDASIS